MPRLFALLFLLAGSPWASHGQGRDTAFAVHKLFVQKRHGGDLTAASGASLISSATSLGDLAAGAVVGAAPVLLGLRQAGRFSAAREQYILSRYADGWPLPADVRHQLRRKHFHRTAKDVILSP